MINIKESRFEVYSIKPKVSPKTINISDKPKINPTKHSQHIIFLLLTNFIAFKIT
jgi:hypothetical protein